MSEWWQWLLFAIVCGSAGGLIYVVLSRLWGWMPRRVHRAALAAEEPVDDPTDPWGPEPNPNGEPKSARIIDPNNPPTWRVYWPQSGTAAPSCSCHNITLQPGDKVILWPIPNHPEGGIDIFCQRTFQEAFE